MLHHTEGPTWWDHDFGQMMANSGAEGYYDRKTMERLIEQAYHLGMKASLDHIQAGRGAIRLTDCDKKNATV